MFCEIYLFDAPYHIDIAFDYISGDGIRCGSIVKVPFGKNNRLRLGVVVKVKESSEGDNLKPVHSVASDRFFFDEEMLGLCLFLKEHTLCTFGEAARTLLPPGALSEKLNIKYSKLARLAISVEEAEARLSSDKRDKIRSAGQA